MIYNLESKVFIPYAFENKMCVHFYIVGAISENCYFQMAEGRSTQLIDGKIINNSLNKSLVYDLNLWIKWTVIQWWYSIYSLVFSESRAFDRLHGDSSNFVVRNLLIFRICSSNEKCTQLFIFHFLMAKKKVKTFSYSSMDTVFWRLKTFVPNVHDAYAHPSTHNLEHGI